MRTACDGFSRNCLLVVCDIQCNINCLAGIKQAVIIIIADNRQLIYPQYWHSAEQY